MLNKSLFLVIFVLFTLGVSALYTFPNGYSATKIAKSPAGKIKFMSGSFGFVTDTSQQSLVNYISAHVDLLGLHGTEQFQLKRDATDPSGALHFHFQQYNHGLEVDGGELSLHVDAKTLEVFALTINVLSDDKYSVLNSPIQRKTLANRFEAIRGIAPVKNFKMMKDPELVYLLHEDHGHLVWRADVEYVPIGQRVPIRSWLYAHAVDGHHVLELNQYMHFLNRQVFDAENNDTLPGELQRVEGEGSVTDASVNQAYDNVGLCYNFYMQTFQRDSYNGQGAMLKSSVHYMVGYNNAFWNGAQMVFGDGDGQNFTDFTGDLTVICHELTHAVVQSTANLRYWRDSGALNEGFADIFGASSDIVMQNNSYSNTTWMIGHKCYLAGQALRYMNNPTQDGYSNDFWPERYQGFQDMGGVHSNSGIANLAYVLLVQGGVHPRQKTTGWVAGVGLDKAMQIFYAALNGYLQSTSDFVAARAATETTALKLYGKFAHDSVAAAWNAVGVPESNV